MDLSDRKWILLGISDWQSIKNWIVDCRFSIGDTQVPFCLQSTSKPLNYALALSDLGEEKVHQYVGHEPSGEHFNVIKLNPQSKYML